MKHKHIALVVGLLLVSLVACGTQAATDSSLAKEFVPADASSLIRVSDEAAVVVDVTPLNLDSPEAGLILQVGLNTHSVDLSYDISQIAVLRTSQGVEIPAQVWNGPTTGGHHVRGQLAFGAVDLKNAEWVEVVLIGVADVPERIFRWDLSA